MSCHLAQRVVWEPRGDKMVEQYTEAVNIAQETGQVIFRRKCRADDLRGRVKDRSAVFACARIHILGQNTRTEVSQLHHLRRDKDVLRFDVPVGHAYVMKM